MNQQRPQGPVPQPPIRRCLRYRPAAAPVHFCIRESGGPKRNAVSPLQHTQKLAAAEAMQAPSQGAGSARQGQNDGTSNEHSATCAVLQARRRGGQLPKGQDAPDTSDEQTALHEWVCDRQANLHTTKSQFAQLAHKLIEHKSTMKESTTQDQQSKLQLCCRLCQINGAASSSTAPQVY